MHRITWFSLAALAVLLLVGVAANTHTTQAETSNPVWSPGAFVNNDIPTSANLTSVFMLDENNAWIAGSDGSQGVAYRLSFADGNWHVIESDTFISLVHAIVAVSDDNVWVAGEHGLLAHKDVSGWQDVEHPMPDINLSTLQIFGNGTEGWAAGDGVLLHLQNGTWQVDNSIAQSQILGLHFVSSSGWAVGPYHIWHYSSDTGKWATELEGCRPGIHPGCQGSIKGVRALADSEAWAVGSYDVLAGGADFGLGLLLLHHTSGGWEEYANPILDDPLPERRAGSYLTGISFTPDGYGLAVGGQQVHEAVPYTSYPFIVSYQHDQHWHYDQVPYLQGALNSISQANATHALAVGNNGLILGYGYGGSAPQPWPTVTEVSTPTSTSSGAIEPTSTFTPIPGSTPTGATNPVLRVPDPQDPDVNYFAETGHTLQGGFLIYWKQNGGLAQFGYPITEEFRELSSTDGKEYMVQYFERNRFEYHPENAPPYDVLLGLLGRSVIKGREDEAPFRPAVPNSNSEYLYFQPTGHNLAPEFKQYWQQHGGLPVYGYPISEPFTEVSPTDGREYLVQYFERNRFEYHPELPELYRVSLGLLGVEILTTRGWLNK